MLPPSYIEALVAADLAVGNYPLQRVKKLMSAFRAADILAPSAVSTLDLGELTVILAQLGYDRGLFTSMYAERLLALMKAIESGSLDRLVDYFVAGKRSRFEVTLQQVFGVGPKVASKAWELLASNGDSVGSPRETYSAIK
jgi:hypothetical protein